MDCLITTRDGSRYLAHHGVKGMKWGKWNSETAARYYGRANEARSKGDAKKADKLERKAIRADYGDIVRQGGREVVSANSMKIHKAAGESAGFGAGVVALKTGFNPVATGLAAVGSFTGSELSNRSRLYITGKRNTEAAIRKALKEGTRVDSLDDVYSKENTSQRNKAHAKDIKIAGIEADVTKAR